MPTNLYLDVKAEYIEDGDTVLVEAWIYDPDSEEQLAHPEFVGTGTTSLIHRGVTVAEICFDRRFGNADGSFKFLFNHPPARFNLQASVTASLLAGHGLSQVGDLAKTVPVTCAAPIDTPLKQQLDTGSDANDELRSKKRIEEQL